MIAKQFKCFSQCKKFYRVCSTDTKVPSKVSIYKSNSSNPFINLAIESWLFSEPKDEDEYVLYLWRNGPSVIIGKFQSAWRECEIQKMEKEGVHLVRRPSGGGAVYHDLGNSIYTFISPRNKNENSVNIERNNSILIDALNTKYDIKAHATGRNDLCVDDLKISGAAFRNSKSRRLHHGTMLLDVDMNALGDYLTPNKVKLQSKGVSSVQARVLNMKTIVPEITHEGLCDAILDAFLKKHNVRDFDKKSIMELDENSDIVQSNKHIQGVIQQLKDWDWRFGAKDPGFTHKIETTRLDWGTFDINLIVKSNVITNATIYTDALNVPLITSIQDKLMQNVEYTKESVERAMEELMTTIDLKDNETLSNIEDLKQLIISSM